MVFPWFSYGFPVHCLSPLMNKPYGVAAVAGLACATCSAALLTAPSASLNSARETPPSWPNSGDVRPRHYKLAIYIYIIYNMYVWMYCMYVCIYIYCVNTVYIYTYGLYINMEYIYIYRCACDRTIVFKYWVIIIPKWCVYINIYIYIHNYIYTYTYTYNTYLYMDCVYI